MMRGVADESTGNGTGGELVWSGACRAGVNEAAKHSHSRVVWMHAMEEKEGCEVVARPARSPIEDERGCV
jgi:hypothetical protein